MYCTEILLDFLSSASQLRNHRVNSQAFSRRRILLAYSHEISKTRHSKTTPTVSLLWNSRRWRHCPCPWTKNFHGCTDKKLIERQTTKMSTETRRNGHINRVESSYGAKAPRGDKYDEIICSIHQRGHPASHHDPPVGGPWLLVFFFFPCKFYLCIKTNE